MSSSAIVIERPLESPRHGQQTTKKVAQAAVSLPQQFVDHSSGFFVVSFAMALVKNRRQIRAKSYERIMGTGRQDKDVSI